MGKLRAKLSYANVVATLGLFIALATGGAYAADQLLGKGEVRSKHIGKAQVKKVDIAKNAVISPKVANGSLLGKDFAAGQLPQGPSGPQGKQGLRGPSGATNVVVRTAPFGPVSVGEAGHEFVLCDAGERATGGGADLDGLVFHGDRVSLSRPMVRYGTGGLAAVHGQVPEGWRAGMHNGGTTPRSGYVFVICASP